MTVFYDSHRAGPVRSGSGWGAAALVALSMAWAVGCGGSPAAPTPPPPSTPDAPTLTCPTDVSTESLDGQSVTVAVQTPTPQGGAPPVSVRCDAPETFPVGATTVTCTATDGLNRTAACSYTVTVSTVPDPPTLTCPANITTQSPDGQPVTVAVQTPTPQGGAPPVTVSCNAPARFAVGTTTVTCTASDALTRTAACSYTVTVRLPDPPTLACPANITTQSPDGQPVSVTFQTPSAQGGAPPVSVRCNAPAMYPIGTTNVTCTASDALSRSAACGFSVRVLAPPQLRFTKFLAFGDSLTAGEVSLSSVVLFLSPTDAYPYRLQGKLQARYRAQTITVINDGVGGEFATEGGIARFGGEIYRHRPDVVLIMEGTNDLPWHTPDRIVNALADMIRDAKQRGVRPMVATIPPARPGGRRDGLPPLIAAYNDQVRALARREGVDLIDVFAAMDLSMIGQDDLHPTPQGYDVMAQTFYDVIASALDVPVTLTSRR